MFGQILLQITSVLCVILICVCSKFVSAWSANEYVTFSTCILLFLCIFLKYITLLTSKMSDSVARQLMFGRVWLFVVLFVGNKMCVCLERYSEQLTCSTLRYGMCFKGSHISTSHPHVYLQRNEQCLLIAFQPHSNTTLRPVLICCPTGGRRLSSLQWLG